MRTGPDRCIHQSNSGGLLNIRVVGINTVKVTRRSWFLHTIDVPTNYQHFIGGGFVTPYIGVVGFDREMASYYNETVMLSESIGGTDKKLSLCRVR